MKAFPKTFSDAVAVGLSQLTTDGRTELARVGFVDPHTKYKTDFEQTISEALGLHEGVNRDLLLDVASNHAEELHFLETDGQLAEPSAVLRLVLAEMVMVLRGNRGARACYELCSVSTKAEVEFPDAPQALPDGRQR